MTSHQIVLALLSGDLVGVTLSMVGGGGSILAVPLIIYVIGVQDPHVAIGTSAVAVAANALVGLAMYAWQKRVKWRCAAVFALPGMASALLGASLGRMTNGQHLLLLFALLMIVVALIMIRGRYHPGVEGAACNRANAPKVVSCGAVTGAFSGFFGLVVDF